MGQSYHEGDLLYLDKLEVILRELTDWSQGGYGHEGVVGKLGVHNLNHLIMGAPGAPHINERYQFRRQIHHLFHHAVWA